MHRIGSYLFCLFAIGVLMIFLIEEGVNMVRLIALIFSLSGFEGTTTLSGGSLVN